MLWVYGHYKYFYSYSAGIDFSRQNPTSTDVRFYPRAVRVKPSRCIKASFCISEVSPNVLQLVVLERKFSWNCFNNIDIFFHLSTTSGHLHPLQVKNCDSNSRLVVDEDDNGKFRLQRVNHLCC